MRVLVDTPVWSEFLRRSAPNEQVNRALRGLIESGEAVLIGPVRQEILSGLSDKGRYEKLRSALGAFPNQPIEDSDYEMAASVCNECRRRGFQGSNTDFLICAVSIRLSAPIFTLDADFEAFERVLPVRLLRFQEG